jgi:hypothetical protein
MQCPTCLNTDLKFCRAVDSIGRPVTRRYCTTCLNFVGALLPYAIAEDCGYELELMTGDSTEWRVDNYTTKYYNKAITEHSDIKIAFSKRGDNMMYQLFCDKCKEVIGSVPHYVIKAWETYTETANISEFRAIVLAGLCKTMVDITPLEQVHRPKIPSILYQDYSYYLQSEKWYRKKENRKALDQNQCRLCFATTQLQVHHVTYGKLFDEPMSHLLTVCKSCHEVIHGHKI